MKGFTLLIFLFYVHSLYAQQVYSVDQVTPIVEMTPPANLEPYKLYDFEVADDGNKYDFGFFQGTYNINNDQLNVIGLSNSFYSGGLRISKFDSQNHYVKSIKVVQGDSIMDYKMIRVRNFLYIMVDYKHRLQFSNDTLVSKGSYDVCIIKVNSNLDIVDKFLIGNYARESIDPEAFFSANDHIYFALNVFENDSTLAVYDNYKLGLGLDTVYADTSLQTGCSEYVICKMDTNLHMVNHKTMGGTLYNRCNNLVVTGNFIYVLCSTHVGSLNRIGDSIISTNININEEPHYLALLNEDFSFRWCRFMGGYGYGYASISTLGAGSNYVYIQGYNTSYTPSVNLLYVEGAGLFSDGGWGIGFDTNGVFHWSRNQVDYFPSFSFLIPDNGMAVFTKQITNNQVLEGKVMTTCDGLQVGLMAIDMHDGSLHELASICEFHQYNNRSRIFRLTKDKHGKLYYSAKTGASLLFNPNTMFDLAQSSTLYYYASFDSMYVFPQNTSSAVSIDAFQVYPNPTTEILHVSFDPIPTSSEIKVLNTFGQLVYQEKLKGVHNKAVEINTSMLPTGLYQIVWIGEGGKIYTRMVSKL